MKIRIGFVSNSSSASFTVLKKGLSPWVIASLIGHIEAANKIGFKNGESRGRHFNEREQWALVKNNKRSMEFSTLMDNFDLNGFARYLGVPDENITYIQDW